MYIKGLKPGILRIFRVIAVQIYVSLIQKKLGIDRLCMGTIKNNTQMIY